MRHAKSDWSIPGQDDFDRTLNDRGNRDAPFMANLFFEKGYRPELFLVSPAKRALQTYQHFTSFFPSVKSMELSHLYHGQIDDFINACIGIEDRYASVMIFAHNPGITYFANTVGVTPIENVATSGILVVDTKFDSWQNTDIDKMLLVDYLYPKM